WLVGALEAQDQARVEWLWHNPGRQWRILEKAVGCFRRRYPDSAAAKRFRHRLADERIGRRRRRVLLGAGIADGLLATLWGYDLYGYQRVSTFGAAPEDEQAIVAENWRSYQTWHPTRHVFWGDTERYEEDRLRDLDALARDRERDRRLAELRQRAADADADPEEVWRQFHAFHAAFPEAEL